MGQPAPTAPKLTTIGNLLTLARLVLLPIIIVGITAKLGYLTVAAMAVALVTDLLDGRMARKFNQQSMFGRTLDSTVDFVLIYSLFIAFYAAGRLETYQFIVIYVAMLTNLMLQISNLGTGEAETVVRTKFLKLTGALQYLYLLFLVAREVLPQGNTIVEYVNLGLFIALAAAVAISSAECIVKLRQMR